MSRGYTLAQDFMNAGFIRPDFVNTDLINAAFINPNDAEIAALLARVRTIAVVGLSPKPERASYRVAQAMQRYGFRIVPVRPQLDRVLDEPAYPTLADVPHPIDLVNVFRAPAHVPAIVADCTALHLPALWLQEGVIHDEACIQAQNVGITVVADRCLLKDYLRLFTA
jgi:predicted CoA-binding protein